MVVVRSDVDIVVVDVKSIVIIDVVVVIAAVVVVVVIIAVFAINRRIKGHKYM